MAFITDHYFVYINSRDRASGTDSQFTYDMKLPASKEFTHLTVLSASIPKSYYLIQPGADSFFLLEGAQTVEISIPQQNYQLGQWATTLTSLLNSKSPNGWVYTVSSTTTLSTGKLIYSVTGNSSQPSIRVTNALFEPFGFNASSTNPFVSNTLTSKNVIKLQSEDRLQIHSNLVKNPGGADVLVSINAGNVVPFSTISYYNPSPDYNTRELSSNNLSLANFTLTNEDGVVLDLNGLNMNITVLLYRKQNPMLLIKEFVKYLITK